MSIYFPAHDALECFCERPVLDDKQRVSQRHERVVHHDTRLVDAVFRANVRAVVVAQISIKARLDRHTGDLCQAGDKDYRVHEQVEGLLVEF